MRLRVSSLISILILIVSLISQAHEVVRDSRTPIQFPVEQNFSGLQEDDIRFLLDQLDQEFGLEIHNTSKSWTAGFDWKMPYLGAGSTYDGQNFKVMLWGGLLRARFMTFGAAATVVCHELGHRLGGSPHQKFPGQDEDWSSSEGQSDFFAATVCLPRLYDRLQKVAPERLKQDLEPSTESLCRASSNPLKCQWVATNGIDMIETLQVYYDLQVPIANPQIWATEEPEETLYTQYPSHQCRMDIYKRGAQNPSAPRLRCWYKPAN